MLKLECIATNLSLIRLLAALTVAIALGGHAQMTSQMRRMDLAGRAADWPTTTPRGSVFCGRYTACLRQSADRVADAER
jgi:hypothetical protein